MDTLITRAVEGLLVPLIAALTAPIPLLASSGVLFLVFAAMWLAFAVALVRDPLRLDAAWRRIRALPLVVEAMAWLLFLPVLTGVWIWHRTWPVAARLALLGGLAGWNLLVLLPQPA